MTRVAIVGGGISGLSAAWELSDDPNVKVTLFEAGPRLGGKIATTTFAGRPVDEGADSLLRRVPHALALIDELGMTEQLTSPRSGTALIWAGGQLRPLPSGHVLGVPVDADAAAATGLLSAEAVQAIRDEPDLPGEPLGADESLGSLIRRRFGDEVLRTLVEPLIGGINAAEADDISTLATVPQIAAGAQRDASLVRGLRAELADRPPPSGPVFAAPKAGMGSLVDELVASLAARGVDLQPDAPLQSLERVNDRWALQVGDASVTVDRVLLAVPAFVAADVLATTSGEAARLLARIRHASVAVITLAFATADLPQGLDATGFLVPRDAGLTITAASWSSLKWDHLADPDVAIMRVSVGHAADDTAVDWPDDQLLAAVLDDLRTTMGLNATPVESRVTRYPRGFPQYDVGHLDRIDRIDAALRRDAPGIAVVGAATRGLGIPSCIAHARASARALLDS